MKAVALTHYLPIENPEAFLDVELPKPEPLGNDLLVSVKAVSVNPVDTKIRGPKEQVEDPPRVLGFDASGVVEAVGPESRCSNPVMKSTTPAILPAPVPTPSFSGWTSALSGTSPKR